MCTSPTTIYSCGHTKPDHIIEFCYTDYEDDCGQVHPRYEHLARKCPRCTRNERSELERKAGIPAHGPHDEDASSTRSASPRSSSPSSPTGEPQLAPARANTAAKVDQYPTTKAAAAAPSPSAHARASCRHCGHATSVTTPTTSVALKQQPQPQNAEAEAEAKAEVEAASPAHTPLLAKDSHTFALNAMLAEHRRLKTTLVLQNEMLAEGLTRRAMRVRNDRLGQEVREAEEMLEKLAVEERARGEQKSRRKDSALG